MLFLLNYYVAKSGENVLIFLKKSEKESFTKTQLLHLRVKNEIYEYRKVEKDTTRNQTKCLHYRPIVDQEFFYAEKTFRPSSTIEELETILLQNNTQLYKYYTLDDEKTKKAKDFDLIDLKELTCVVQTIDVEKTLSKMYIHINIFGPSEGYTAPLPRITEDLYKSYSPAPKELINRYIRTQAIWSIDLKFEEAPWFQKDTLSNHQSFKLKGNEKEVEMYEAFLKYFEEMNPDVIFIKSAEDLLYMKDRLYHLGKSNLALKLNYLLNRRSNDIKSSHQPSVSDEKRNLTSTLPNSGSFVDLYFKDGEENGFQLEQWNSQLFGRILLEFKTLGNALLLKEGDDEFTLQYSLPNFTRIMYKNKNILSILMSLCGMLSLNIYHYLNKSKIAFKTVYYMNKDNKDHQVLFDRDITTSSGVTTNKKHNTLSTSTSTMEIKNSLKSSSKGINYSENIKLLTKHFDQNTLGCPPLAVTNETYHSNVAQVDFKSFFPSLLIYYNLSVENIVSQSNSNEKDQEGDGESVSFINRYKHEVQIEKEDKTLETYPVYISPKRLGIIPSTMINLLKLREIAVGSKNAVQNQTFKLLSNCIAGVLSKSKFDLGSPLIHCLMIQKSKVFFDGLINWLKKKDYVPIHGQCDGMFVPLKINYEEDVEIRSLKGIPDVDDLETTIKGYLSNEFDTIEEMTPFTTSQISNPIGNEDFKLNISSTYYKDFYIINLKSYLAIKQPIEFSVKDVPSSKDIIRKDLTVKGAGYVQYHVLSDLFLHLIDPNTSTLKKTREPDLERLVSLFEEGVMKWYSHDLHCIERKIHVHRLPKSKNNNIPLKNDGKTRTSIKSNHTKTNLSLSDKTLIIKYVGIVNAFFQLREEIKVDLTRTLTDIYYDFTKEYHRTNDKLNLPLKKTKPRLFSEMDQ